MRGHYLDRLRRIRTKAPKTYAPSQDTELLRRTVKECRGRYALEIGFGNGSIIGELTKNFEFAAGTELVLPRGAVTSIGRGCGVAVADRATCFRSSIFDLVVFNPPYLPSGLLEDIAVDGGRGGIEVPLLFLDEALRVLRQDGTILLVLSSDGDLTRFEEGCRSRTLDVRVAAERDLFYETLYVYELKRVSDYPEALSLSSVSALI